MSTIVTRAGKGSALTHTEVDANFTNLNTDKLQSGDTAASLTITSADINGGTVDGTDIGSSNASTGAFTTLSATGVTTVQAGTAAAPAITTSGDTNTGIFFPAADTIAFTEGGGEKLRLNSSGQLILNTTGTAYATGGVTAQYQIGGTTQATSSMSLITSSATTTTDPTIFLAKNKSGTQGTFTTAVVNTDELGAIAFAGSNTSTLSPGAAITAVATDTWSTTSLPTSLVFSTVEGGATTLSERMRITQNGEVIVGAGVSGVTEVTGYGLTSMSSAGGYLNLYRNDASVVSGNALGTIDFYSNGSGSILYAATIGAEAGGTFTVSSTPSELVFYTCPSGSTTTAEAVRIKSGGGLQISRTAVTAPATGDGNVFSGTYPSGSITLTNGTNVTASTATDCQYMRVGNTVTISGTITGITTTAAGNSLVSMSIPVASNFSAVANAAGAGCFYSTTLRSTAIAAYADTTNDRITFNFNASGASTAQAFSFTVTYRVI